MDSVVSGVQVLDRAVALLDSVANSGASSLADLVADTTLARPTAYRLAVALEQHGLLARDEDGRFVLGGRLRSWGSLAARGLPVAAQPVLAELAATTGESAQLYVREGDRRVCVAVHERATGLRDTVPLGAVMPLARGSGGKVLLAWSEDAPDHGIAPAELAAIRRRGWAESVGEREPGVASVSAPVRDSAGRIVAAISVSGPIGRLGEHPGRRLARSVGAAAERLGRVIAE
jgi:DNA-binding IclR family transcriptional regulator